MPADKESNNKEQIISSAKVKFEVYGEEMIEKEVKSSGNSGRIYLFLYHLFTIDFKLYLG